MFMSRVSKVKSFSNKAALKIVWQVTTIRIVILENLFGDSESILAFLFKIFLKSFSESFA